MTKNHDRVARTMNEAFGPYAKLHIEPKRMPLRDKIAAFAVMVAIGVVWYLVVAIKAGVQ